MSHERRHGARVFLRKEILIPLGILGLFVLGYLWLLKKVIDLGMGGGGGGGGGGVHRKGGHH